MTDTSLLTTKILDYIQSRKDDKLEAFEKKGKKERAAITNSLELLEFEAQFERDKQKIIRDHEPATWLTDAAKRAPQIKCVTHALKFTHTDAKGSSIYTHHSKPLWEDALEASYISTTSLTQIEVDCDGNAAALDVAKLLLLKTETLTLLGLLRNDDYSALEPLATSASQLEEWRQNFFRALYPQKLSTHTLAKQVYFPIDPLNDTMEYHLLLPLFASSLNQALYEEIQASYFSEAQTAGRKAKKNNQYHPEVVRKYLQVLQQGFGGSKPQNVSQLNTRRRGTVYLFSCAPPHWDTQHKKPPTRLASIFDTHGEFHRRAKGIAKELRHYLWGDPPRNITVRGRRDEYVEQLLDELFQYASEVRSFPSGWSANARLPRAQKLWLDPDAQGVQPQSNTENLQEENPDWLKEIAQDFARWLNTQLKYENRLSIGDDELQKWQKDFLEQARQYGFDTVAKPAFTTEETSL